MRLSETQRLITGKIAPLGDFGRLLRKLRVDGPLLGGILLICALGLVVLYSAVGESTRLLMNQVVRLGVAMVAMFIMAQMSPDFLRRWTPWGFLAGLVLLVLVLTTGEVGQGARRWLDLGIRFQPSEIMKLVVPMAVAWYLADRILPPRFKYVIAALVMLGLPALLILQQPDLGTALLIAASGLFVLFMAGIGWRYIVGAFVLAIASAWPAWMFVLKDYQKQRILTMLNPESDKLGAGWNIIQSKTAIGSGGWAGKGWNFHRVAIFAAAQDSAGSDMARPSVRHSSIMPHPRPMPSGPPMMDSSGTNTS